MRLRPFWLLVVALLILAGCGNGASPTGAGTSAGSSAASVKQPPKPSGASSADAATAAPIAPRDASKTLKIGVTLHPYYSWVANVLGDAKGVELVAILPGDVDSGDYQPSPEDIKKLSDLDGLVVNGIGHDEFIPDMVKASGNASLVVIKANDGTPLLPGAHGEAVNSHTFLSFTNAIQQTYAIAKILGQLRPDLNDALQKNADEYAKRLRKIKASAATQLANAKTKRVVTVHDGYSYLCQEFGVSIAGVVQPSHGLTPSAEELGGMVDLLGKEKIDVILTEESFPAKLLDVLAKSRPVRVYVISHVAKGKYRASEFEEVMQQNVDTLVKALVTDG
ncbi:MAG: zinc ABC transporter substrate-binding protein [Polyangiaceae bacterium]